MSFTAFPDSEVVHLSTVAVHTDDCQPEDAEEPDMNGARLEPSIQMARSVTGKLTQFCLALFHDVYISSQHGT